MIQLLIGGVRSGKSAAAEELLHDLISQHPILTPHYIATSLSTDEESIQRIQQHQAMRELRFKQPINTHELDYRTNNLDALLKTLNHSDNILLIECLSTWVGWYLTQSEYLQENLNAFKSVQSAFLSFLSQCKCSVIIVTGEVGCGLIGESKLQRRYADTLGELNQAVAKIADSVYLLTAGIKQQIKSPNRQ